MNTACLPAVLGLDYLEFYVGNPLHAAHFYQSTFGLAVIGHSGFKTGVHDRCAYAVSSGNVRFLLTGPVHDDSMIAHRIHLRGDAVADVAFTVSDVEAVFHRALSNGAEPASEPRMERVGDRQIVRAAIRGFGDVVHTLVQRDHGPWFLPGLAPTRMASAPPSFIAAVDHIAVCTPYGDLARQVEFYTSVFGLKLSHEQYVTTDRSSMNTSIVESPGGAVRLPLIEGTAGRQKSQVDEYLRFNHGTGVQHVALTSDDIVRAVTTLQNKGVDFLSTPSAYYDILPDRLGRLDEDTAALRRLNILADRDPWGYLLQIFSKPLQARPTFFMEVIQRKGARGFGAGNIRALFEAVEREQALRAEGCAVQRS